MGPGFCAPVQPGAALASPAPGPLQELSCQCLGVETLKPSLPSCFVPPSVVQGAVKTAGTSLWVGLPRKLPAGLLGFLPKVLKPSRLTQHDWELTVTRDNSERTRFRAINSAI